MRLAIVEPPLLLLPLPTKSLNLAPPRDGGGGIEVGVVSRGVLFRLPWLDQIFCFNVDSMLLDLLEPKVCPLLGFGSQ